MVCWMRRPLVSIVLPYHNREAYIGQALDSLAAQTYPYIELILADDASDDESNYRIKAALGRSGRRYTRFTRVKSRRRVGLAKTINSGMRRASGVFVGILYAEDRMQSRRLERMIERMVETQSTVSFSDCLPIDENGYAYGGPFFDSVESMQSKWVYENCMTLAAIDQNPTVCAGNLLMKNKIWRRLGGLRYERPTCDWDLFLRSSLLTEPLYVPEAFYEARFLSKSLTRIEGIWEKKNEMLLGIEQTVEHRQFENERVAQHRDEILARLDRAIR